MNSEKRARGKETKQTLRTVRIIYMAPRARTVGERNTLNTQLTRFALYIIWVHVSRDVRFTQAETQCMYMSANIGCPSSPMKT